MAIGIPKFRTRVLYVPQRPSILPGTPRDFIDTILSFSSRNPKHSKQQSVHTEDFNPRTEPIHVASQWGVDEELWDRTWSSLSGGEAQRIALAVAVGLQSADVLLLDGAHMFFSGILSTALLIVSYLRADLCFGRRVFSQGRTLPSRCHTFSLRRPERSRLDHAFTGAGWSRR